MLRLMAAALVQLSGSEPAHHHSERRIAIQTMTTNAVEEEDGREGRVGRGEEDEEGEKEG